MFNGDNLTHLRIMHGYSRKQLSEMLGVTEQAVWQYENSYTSPKMQIVNELKRIFHVKSKYFYTKDILTQYGTPANIDVMNIAHLSLIHICSRKRRTGNYYFSLWKHSFSWRSGWAASIRQAYGSEIYSVLGFNRTLYSHRYFCHDFYSSA